MPSTAGRSKPVVRLFLAGMATAAALLVCTIGALAVSSGGYRPSQQGCSPAADANSKSRAEPGCRNTAVNFSDGRGSRYVEAGTYQQARGDNLHRGSIMLRPTGRTGPAAGLALDTNYQPIPRGQCGLFDIPLYPLELIARQGSAPCTLDPTAWRAPSQPPTADPTLRAGNPSTAPLGLLTTWNLYFGADDNLNTGEHDGVSGRNGTKGSVNGPSDGGSLHAGWHPYDLFAWLDDLMAVPSGGGLAPIAENPGAPANAGGGFCVDGICVDAETRREVVYHGGGGAGQARNAYDYQGKTWDPYEGSSADPKSEKACFTQGGHSMDWYRRREVRNVYAQPGVQIYQDPDPQSSPALPAATYPLPALYAGTCGVVAGGGALQAPPSPLTNRAGQIAVTPTGC
jgi:hypothetical protein